jgi:hypothetical protein
MEYLVRRTDFDTGDPALFKYAIAPRQGNYFTKHGAYVELEQPVATDFDFVVRVDALARIGNVPVGITDLAYRSGMLRETLGLAYTVERNLRLKTSVEYYEYSDLDTNGRTNDVAIHAGVTGTF